MNPPKYNLGSYLSTDLTFLERLLSCIIVLYIKTRKLQWYVQGGEFISPNRVFKSLYISIEDTVEHLSDRINQLGGVATLAIQSGTEQSRQNLPLGKQSQEEVMAELLNEHTITIDRITNEIGNFKNLHRSMEINDFLLDILEKHETINAKLINVCQGIAARQTIRASIL